MFQRKRISSLLIAYFCLLILSPLWGWHVHHACIEKTHGFEEHTTQEQADHHERVCPPESVLGHTFEQGSEITKAESVDIVHVQDLFVFLPIITTARPHFELIVELGQPTDFDTGLTRYFQTSLSSRAPPTSLS